MSVLMVLMTVNTTVWTQLVPSLVPVSLATLWVPMDSAATVCSHLYDIVHSNITMDSCSADIDECALGTDTCAHGCQDTQGSYTCTCQDGYTLNTDGRTCRGKELLQGFYRARYWSGCLFADINECTLGTHRCVQTCTNTAGSYTCGCNTGYMLNSNGFTCDGEIFSTVCSHVLTVVLCCAQTSMSVVPALLTTASTLVSIFQAPTHVSAILASDWTATGSLAQVRNITT